MRKGRDLELLVKHIESILAHGKNANIESPKMIADKETGQLREHDVVISFTGHHALSVAIDCKDWARPVDSPEIEAFVTKCTATNIQRGMIVSKSGFTSPAIKKASAHGIICLTLKDALEFDWLLAPGVSMRSRSFGHLRLVPLLSDTKMMKAAKVGAVTLLDEHQSDIPNQIAMNAINSAISQIRDIKDETIGGEYVERFTLVPEPGWSVRIAGYPDAVPVPKFAVDVQYVVSESLVPFTMLEYQLAEDGHLITQTAYADVDVGGYIVRVTLVHKSGEGARVFVERLDKPTS